MGKLLQTLSHTTATEERQPPAATAPAAESVIPFIEVGGRQTPVEGSPEVLAAPPPRPVAGPRFQKLTVPAAEVRSVQFRPVTGGPAPARFAPELVTFHRPQHAVSRQYQALADALSEGLSAGGSAVLLFTAAAPGLGATTVLLNVAIALARGGEQRVVVVDAQRDRPAVAERLGLPPVPGLEDVLAGRIAPGDALQQTGQDRLLALTAGRGRGRPGSRWPAEALRQLVRQLAEPEGLVLIDAPCWDGRPELRTLAAQADAVYLVSAPGEDGMTSELLQALPRDGVRLRGQVLLGR
jgi:Mrp family chromosome partitioning ATPase